MKRKLLFLLAVASLYPCQGARLFAQDGYIPRNEFTVNAFGGPNLGMYTASGSYDIRKGFVPAFGAGIGYIHHFNGSWAFMTGLDAAIHTYHVGTDNADYVDLRSGMAYSYPDPAGTLKAMRIFMHYNFRETARLGSLQLPLMLQFKAPLSEKIHFYAAGGATLGFNLYGKYEQSVDKVEMTDILYEGMVDPTFLPGIDATALIYDSEGKLKGDFDRNPMDVKASLELGFRWALSRSVGIYTGVFVDYGFISPFADQERSLVSDETDPSVWNATAPGVIPPKPWTDRTMFRGHSIFNSRQDPKTTLDTSSPAGAELKSIGGTVGSPYLDKIQAGMAGFKVRISFGKARRTPRQSVPAAVNVPAGRDTVTKVVHVRDTVTVEKVVRDTVTITKEAPVEIRKAMKELSNTLFAFDKFDLNEKARGYLDEVVIWLKDNEDLRVEIGGHTDGIGSESYNQTLSESRAKEVYTYFVEHGVNPANLSYKGYGKSQPVAPNDTEEGRRQNRRVELKILPRTDSGMSK